MFARLRAWARSLRRDVVALWLAARDPRVPLWLKALAAFVAAYALSPIDLIPDFIPVLGYLDELILLPLAIAGLTKLIDPVVLAEHRATADRRANKPVSRVGAAIIIGLWIAAALVLLWAFWPSRAA